MKLPISIHAIGGDLNNCTSNVQLMWDQLRKLSDGQVDGFNLKSSLLGDGLDWRDSDDSTKPPQIINILAPLPPNPPPPPPPPLPPGPLGPGCWPKINGDVPEGIEILVKSGSTYGSVCIVDSQDLQYPKRQLARLIPDISTGTTPGLEFKTPLGELTLTAKSGMNVKTANQFKVSIATGTAPFSITSTTKVANLNVQYLNGHEDTYFAVAGAAPTAHTLDGASHTIGSLSTTYVPKMSSSGAVLQNSAISDDGSQVYVNSTLSALHLVIQENDAPGDDEITGGAATPDLHWKSPFDASVQTAERIAHKDAASGYCGLDASSKVAKSKISGTGTFAVSDGGTGASTAATARTGLGISAFANGQVTTLSMTGNLTLTASSTPMQWLDPNNAGGDRDVNLPTGAAYMSFVIVNTGPGGNLIVKDSGGSGVTVCYSGQAVMLIYMETWKFVRWAIAAAG